MNGVSFDLTFFTHSIAISTPNSRKTHSISFVINVSASFVDTSPAELIFLQFF